MRIQWAKNDTFRDIGIVLPRDVEQHRDIPYGPHGAWNLLDVYRPAGVEKPLSVIVSVHGGGYFYGNRDLYRPYCMALAQMGFAVVNCEYRLAPENRFPAPLEDVNAVLDWIVSNEMGYGMDANNLFMVGDSAGAQIVSQYAAIYANEDYRALFGMTRPNVTLRAVGLNCGMYDLPARKEVDHPIMSDYFGDFQGDAALLDVLSHINADYPPAFVLSSPNDFLYECCRPMAEHINRQGGYAEAHIYGAERDTHVGHVFHIDRRIAVGKQANREQTAFFRRYEDVE